MNRRFLLAVFSSLIRPGGSLCLICGECDKMSTTFITFKRLHKNIQKIFATWKVSAMKLLLFHWIILNKFYDYFFLTLKNIERYRLRKVLKKSIWSDHHFIHSRGPLSESVRFSEKKVLAAGVVRVVSAQLHAADSVKMRGSSVPDKQVLSR